MSEKKVPYTNAPRSFFFEKQNNSKVIKLKKKFFGIFPTISFVYNMFFFLVSLSTKRMHWKYVAFLSLCGAAIFASLFFLDASNSRLWPWLVNKIRVKWHSQSTFSNEQYINDGLFYIIKGETKNLPEIKQTNKKSPCFYCEKRNIIPRNVNSLF